MHGGNCLGLSWTIEPAPHHELLILVHIHVYMHVVHMYVLTIVSFNIEATVIQVQILTI
jgi:hypothetical protein